jgi:hypothetical protein
VVPEHAVGGRDRDRCVVDVPGGDLDTGEHARRVEQIDQPPLPGSVRPDEVGEHVGVPRGHQVRVDVFA